MALKDDADFEEKLAQLTRLYRAMRTIWGNTNASSQKQITNWVTTGGKVLDKLNDVIADVEDYAGCLELRVIWDDLKTKRLERDGQKERL